MTPSVTLGDSSLKEGAKKRGTRSHSEGAEKGRKSSLKTTSHPGEGVRSLPLFRAFSLRFLSGQAGINLLLKC